MLTDGYFLKVQRDAIELREVSRPAANISSNPVRVMTLFLAHGLVASERKLDDGEFLDVFLAPLTEVLIWVREGKVTDVKTVIGTFWLEKSWPKTGSCLNNPIVKVTIAKKKKPALRANRSVV